MLQLFSILVNNYKKEKYLEKIIKKYRQMFKFRLELRRKSFEVNNEEKKESIRKVI